MLRLHLVGPRTGTPLQAALADAPWEAAGFALGDAGADVHVLVAETPVSPADQRAVLEQARASGAVLVIAGPTLRHLTGGELNLLHAAEANQPPPHHVRLLPEALDWPFGPVEVLDTFPLTDPVGRTLVTASVAYAVYPVATVLPPGDVIAVGVGNVPQTWSDLRFLQLLHQMCATALGRQAAGDIGIGLLGFGAIGAEHAAAIRATPGLRLAAVADPNPERRAAAAALVDGLPLFESSDALLEQPDVQLVVVSTPPNTHALWAERALKAGRHVVLEKPMALTAAECDAVLDLAESRGLTALVYQNRRFDPDFRTIMRASDSLGEVFHVEAFIGGHSHPCSYWHSEVTVSGGALFDWGSHVIDQLLQLLPGGIEYVTAINHKRVWHDVTNADHARMTIVMEGGREATFIYSDLAAAIKPRWYVLGTKGAIVGDWRYERVITRSAIGTLDEDVLAPADSPPVMRFVAPDGSVTVLAPPPTEAYPFHADLALWLRWGIPPRVRGSESRRVVSVLQAAEESAALGGLPVKPS